jgi:hypothetical protein
VSVEEFWAWWHQRREPLVAALDAGEPVPDLIGQIAELGLSSELSPGESARHALCVSCGGDPALRKLAYRWFDAAPAADEAIEFHPARIASPGADSMVMAVDGAHFAFAELRFDIEYDAQSEQLDVEVQHPGFAVLAEEQRAIVGYVALDNLLGEEEVERWLGAIDFGAAVDAADGPADLRARVAELRADAPASGTWIVLKGRGDDVGAPAPIAIAARPLRPVDHPYFDELCVLSAPPDDLPALQDNEEEIASRFAERAFHAASLTEAGLRIAFVYVDADAGTADELCAWAQERGYQTERRIDPAWDAVRPFR